MNPLLVVVGMPGAGKSTVVSYLAKRNWPVIYFGRITLDEINRRGLKPSQENEQKVRESLRKVYGNAVYAQKSLNSILKSLESSPTIIDGLYSWEEYKFLRSKITNPVYVIAVCAERQLRYNRLKKRCSRSLSAAEAEKRDFAEIEYIQKGGPIAIADFTMLNNGSKDDLEVFVDHVLCSLN